MKINSLVEKCTAKEDMVSLFELLGFLISRWSILGAAARLRYRTRFEKLLVPQRRGYSVEYPLEMVYSRIFQYKRSQRQDLVHLFLGLHRTLENIRNDFKISDPQQRLTLIESISKWVSFFPNNSNVFIFSFVPTTLAKSLTVLYRPGSILKDISIPSIFWPSPAPMDVFLSTFRDILIFYRMNSPIFWLN